MKTTYTYKQVNMPDVAQEMAKKLIDKKDKRMADVWINSLVDYKWLKSQADKLGCTVEDIKKRVEGFK